MGMDAGIAAVVGHTGYADRKMPHQMDAVGLFRGGLSSGLSGPKSADPEDSSCFAILRLKSRSLVPGASSAVGRQR